jgi:diguanylate cyclase (GGDEF)-like protein
MNPIAYAALGHKDADIGVTALTSLGFLVRRIEPDDRAPIQVAAMRPDVVVVDLAGVPAVAPRVTSALREHSTVLSASADVLEVNARVSLLGRMTRDRRRAQEQSLRIQAEMSKMRRLVALDPLTELYNRRHLHEFLTREMKRCRRYGQTLACVMVDIDHFKRVNDEFGHEVGDQALKGVARTLVNVSGDTAIVARYGGEEFCLVLPEMGIEQAYKLANQARRQVQALPLLLQGAQIEITISAGVALYDESEPLSPTDLLKRADVAMYRAKTSGRNRVCCHDEAPSPQVELRAWPRLREAS